MRYDVNAILFDEPLTVIDPHMKWQLRTKLKELHEQFEHTMIYVTHDQTEALTFADKVVVMYDGEVVQIGTPEELFDEPAHTFVGYFIGSPGMNILPGEVSGNRVRVAGGEFALERRYAALGGGMGGGMGGGTSDGTGGGTSGGQGGGQGGGLGGGTGGGSGASVVEIGIRPEFVRVTDAAGANGAGLPMQVRAVENVGRQQIVRGSVGGHDVDAVIEEGARACRPRRSPCSIRRG